MENMLWITFLSFIQKNVQIQVKHPVLYFLIDILQCENCLLGRRELWGSAQAANIALHIPCNHHLLEIFQPDSYLK